MDALRAEAARQQHELSERMETALAVLSRRVEHAVARHQEYILVSIKRFLPF